jgi:hypothetical protein
MRGRAVVLLSALVGLTALPGPASASPVLTEMGAWVVPGATVRETNVGNILITAPLETGTCAQTSMHGNVIANSGTQIEIEFSSVSFVDCTGSFAKSVKAKNLPWCWKASSKMTADTFELRGGKCSAAAEPLTLLMNEGCPYTRTALTGSLRTGPEDAFLPVPEQEFTREPGSLCPTPIKLDINYTLETAEGAFTTLVIS